MTNCFKYMCFIRPEHARKQISESASGRIMFATLVLALLAGCAGATRWENDAPRTTEKVSGSQPRSSSGNPPFYEVFGQRYYVLNSSAGYRERGIASWYGKKFHGNPTSSGEIYNMYAMTAAHKTLPLPTDVRVTNLSNGRTIIVKVNDRGPFVDNRIIDLSYSAAQDLDMISAGTAFVEVETLTRDAERMPVLADSSEQPSLLQTAISIVNPISSAAAETVPEQPVASLYLQVGAFGENANAQKLRRQLNSHGIFNVVIRSDQSREPVLHRVRLGPISNVDEYDALLERVAAIDIKETHLVTETEEHGAQDLSASELGGLSGG
jgi:rare lipoprotein A